MKKYKTIDELDARIERIITGTVKHYYTDWKNYDRPKYMKLKSSNNPEDKHMILIARKCGTYLLTLEAIQTSEGARAIYDYYQTQEEADYYYINLEKFTISRINPKEIKRVDLIAA